MRESNQTLKSLSHPALVVVTTVALFDLPIQNFHQSCKISLKLTLKLIGYRIQIAIRIRGITGQKVL